MHQYEKDLLQVCCSGFIPDSWPGANSSPLNVNPHKKEKCNKQQPQQQQQKKTELMGVEKVETTNIVCECV